MQDLFKTHDVLYFYFQGAAPQPTLFYYETGGHTDYQDNDFIPDYEAPDRSTLPPNLVTEIDRICGDNPQCIFDMSLTQSSDVGELTMEAVNYDKLSKMYTHPSKCLATESIILEGDMNASHSQSKRVCE